MSERKITVKEALEITVRMIEGIRVPVGLMDEIGIPLKKVTQNLKACISAQNKADKEEPEAPAEEGEEHERDADAE